MRIFVGTVLGAALGAVVGWLMLYDVTVFFTLAAGGDIRLLGTSVATLAGGITGAVGAVRRTRARPLLLAMLFLALVVALLLILAIPFRQVQDVAALQHLRW